MYSFYVCPGDRHSALWEHVPDKLCPRSSNCALTVSPGALCPQELCVPRSSNCVPRSASCVPRSSVSPGALIVLCVPRSSVSLGALTVLKLCPQELCVPRSSNCVPRNANCVPRSSNCVPKISKVAEKWGTCVEWWIWFRLRSKIYTFLWLSNPSLSWVLGLHLACLSIWNWS